MASPTRPDGVTTMSMEKLSDFLKNAEEELARLTEIRINYDLDVQLLQLHCEHVKHAYDEFEIRSRITKVDLLHLQTYVADIGKPDSGIWQRSTS